MTKNNPKPKVPKRRNRRDTTPKVRVSVDNGAASENSIERLSLEVHRDVKNQIIGLMKPTQSTSITEVIRKAARLLEAVCLIQETGGKVFFQQVNGDFERVVIL